MYQFKVKKTFKYKGDVYIRNKQFKVKKDAMDDEINNLMELYFLAPINKEAKKLVDELRYLWANSREIKRVFKPIVNDREAKND